MSQRYLKTYFAERALPNRTISVTEVYDFGERSRNHFIELDAIVEMLVNVAPDREQQMAADKIREIEFKAPAEIHGYMNHLAVCFINQQVGGFEDGGFVSLVQPEMN